MSDNQPQPSSDFKPWGMEIRTFAMLMNLAPLLNAIIPLGGIVLFVVMWATNKDKSPFVDNQGKAILNWMLSALIYCVVSFILIIIIIGIPLLIAVGICTLVFMIIGAIKSNGGIVWKYPLSIPFFKVDTSVTA